MRKLILIFSLSLLTQVVLGQKIDCRHLKVGTFVEMENGVEKVRIKRTKKYQFEEYGEITIKLNIKWSDDGCAYTLSFVTGNKAYWDRYNEPISDLFIEILDVQENTYVQQSRFVDQKAFNHISTIMKIK